ncbi:MAG: hypothetical protein H6R00_3732 [Proteobacteria bacterium]|nr:hypothetical protein [Pseudomonadota bacterium]
MTSFLVESILLVALIGTIVGLLVFRRELRELKSNQANYATSLDETGVALMTVGNAIREINMQGLTTLQNLIVEIERARTMLDELEKAATPVPAEPMRSSARAAGR